MSRATTRRTRIAIHHPAIRVAEKRAIRIAIKGDAQIELPRLLCDCSGQRFGMQGAAIIVDVFPVRRCAQISCLNAASAKQFRGFSRGRAVGAIHQNSVFRPSPSSALRQPLLRRHAEGLPRRASWEQVSQRGGAWRSGFCSRAKISCSMASSWRVRQLVSIAGENFDAIVGPGIVRGRNHNAGGMFPGTREVGHPGRRNHARAMDFTAAGNQSQHHAVRNPGARFPRVLSDHNAGVRIDCESGHDPARGQ